MLIAKSCSQEVNIGVDFPDIMVTGLVFCKNSFKGGVTQRRPQYGWNAELDKLPGSYA